MIAIKNGTLLTMDTPGNIERGTILVEGEHIKRVGASVRTPRGCTQIDAEGLFICPGFIDAHTHIGLEEEIYRLEGNDVNEINDPVVPQLKAVDGVNFLDLAFKDALRGGVTRTLCLPGSANIIGGQGVMLKSYASLPGDMVYREPWGLKAALGENPKRVYAGQKKTPSTRMANASLLREVLFTGQRLLEKDKLESREAYKYQAVFQVLRKEIPLRVHAHRADDILTALRIKDEFQLELIIEHGTEAHLVAGELNRRGVPVCLGPLLVNRAKVEMKEVSFKNAARLKELGVEFCLVTDHPVVPIEHLRVCASLTVREGLDARTALGAITVNPARILKVDDELGSIRPGKRADLVAFEGHPLDFNSRVKWVMVDGRLWRDLD
jgi:imidazolonepropionase-like amidohydrolase